MSKVDKEKQPLIQIKTQTMGHRPGREINTLYYQKFVVIDGVVVGELVPSKYDKMRFKECFR